MTEIRWHGRGGQGAKTAAQLLAMAVLGAGKSVQAFPEYGPERSGSPMQAYNRIDDRPIRRRYGVYAPHYVVVLDDSLLAQVDVARGLCRGGLLLVNTALSAAEVGARAGYEGRVWCLAADAVAGTVYGGFANVVLLGALARALGYVPWETLADAVRGLFARRLAPPGVENTVAATWLGYAWAEGREVA